MFNGLGNASKVVVNKVGKNVKAALDLLYGGGGGGGDTTTASNGLTLVGSDVRLGGTLAPGGAIIEADDNKVVINAGGTKGGMATYVVQDDGRNSSFIITATAGINGPGVTLASATPGIGSVGIECSRDGLGVDNLRFLFSGVSHLTLPNTDLTGHTPGEVGQVFMSRGSGLAPIWGDVGLLKRKLIDIGDWNMDADASKLVAHGELFTDIRAIHATIRNDDSTLYHTLPGNLTDNVDVNLTWDSTNIIMARRPSVAFDSVDYDSTSYNRGFIIIEYV